MIKSKKQILEEEGYRYNFDREIYINKKNRKIFSQDAIDDHDENWLSEKLKEPSDDEWKFYFNGPPSENIKEQILSELNEK